MCEPRMSVPPAARTGAGHERTKEVLSCRRFSFVRRPSTEGDGMAYPKPRIRVSPALKAACLQNGRQFWQLAIQAGFTHPSRLSYLINAADVPKTDCNINALRSIAEVVGFPAEQLFLDEVPR